MRRLLLSLLFSQSLMATSIPQALTASDLNRVTQLIAMGGTTRLLRAADAYSSWPGFRIGAELTFFPGDRLLTLGNGAGATSAFLPIPRIHVAKGLAEGLEIVGGFFFGGLNTVSSVGGILKWTAIPESEEWLSVALIGGLTSVTAFQGEFDGTTGEVGVVISKDYVRFKPYIGASVLLAGGKIPASLAAPGAPTATSTLVGSHFYVGMEWELPVNLTLQADLTNLDPLVSFFIGKKF